MMPHVASTEALADAIDMEHHKIDIEATSAAAAEKAAAAKASDSCSFAKLFFAPKNLKLLLTAFLLTTAQEFTGIVAINLF